jgi:hypothetical protein
MFAIGNEQLDSAVDIGASIMCDKCGKRHKVKYGDEVMEDGTKKKCTLLSFYKCGGKTYLAGIRGKRI